MFEPKYSVIMVSLVLACARLCTVRTCLENPPRSLNFESTLSRPWKSLKISAIHSWSVKVLEFLLTPIFESIFENFSKSDLAPQAISYKRDELWGREWLPVPLHYFQARTLWKMSNNRIRQTIFMGEFYVNKKEVPQILNCGPWKSLSFWSKIVYEPWKC